MCVLGKWRENGGRMAGEWRENGGRMAGEWQGGFDAHLEEPARRVAHSAVQAECDGERESRVREERVAD